MSASRQSDIAARHQLGEICKNHDLSIASHEGRKEKRLKGRGGTLQGKNIEEGSAIKGRFKGRGSQGGGALQEEKRAERAGEDKGHVGQRTSPRKVREAVAEVHDEGNTEIKP